MKKKEKKTTKKPKKQNQKHCVVMLFKEFVINTVESHRAPLVPNDVSHKFCSTVQHHTNICHLHVPFTVFTDILKNVPIHA